MALLDIYKNPLNKREISHLLRRAAFGGTPSQIDDLNGKSASQIVDLLLNGVPTINPPTDLDNKTFHDLAFGFPETELLAQTKKNASAIAYTKRWWVGVMIGQGSLNEKMTLFWQNHFVSTATEVVDVRYLYSQNELLRKNALGNFKNFVLEITKNPTMLIYLNGSQNVVGKPNENYGRELQELFTIGRGNYNEDDVKNAAKVLAGWKPIGYRNSITPEIGTEFKIGSHDTSDKVFSAAYQNKVIKGRTSASAGNDELKELIDMILLQKETSRYIIRKFYRWFVEADISQQVENEVIEPLSTAFIKDYEIKPIIATLLKSQHFFDKNLLGSQIKSPLDLVIGTLRYFNQTLPNAITDRQAYDLFTSFMYSKAKEQQMDVMDQPSVFGWRPFYDTNFYEIWISATTLAHRGSFTDAIVKGSNTMKINIDTISIAKKTTVPGDPIKLINEITETLFATPLTTKQKDYLIDNVLIQGLPRYEWELEWNTYTSDPNNLSKKNAVKSKLDTLFQYLLRMAEYQMG